MLPRLDYPIYELILPVSKQKIRFRPFRVKEQRNLLMAMETKDTKSVNLAIQSVLANVTLTEGLDLGKLPLIDIEYYFINLRAKSVGELVELKYKCNNEVKGEDGKEKLCGNIMETEVDLTKIVVDLDPTHNTEIKLTGNIILKMKYPDFNSVEEAIKFDSITDVGLNMIASSIEYIYDGEQFFYATEAQPGELVDFIEQMSQEQYDKVEEFFDTLPTLKQTLKMKCSKCGFDHTIEVEGLESFFG